MVSKKKQVEIEDRRKVIAANILAGLTYRQMSEAIGVSLGTITNDVAVILGRWQKEQVKDTDQYVQLELTRLDRALNAIWSKVTSGDFRAIDSMLKIMERRAKYIGLDAPTRQTNVNVDVSNLTDEQLERIAAGDDPAVVISTIKSGG